MTHTLRFTLIASLLAALLLGTLPVPAAHAATFVVTKTADTADGTCDADCSLREAIIAANAAAGDDTITVPAGTYTLTIAGTDENVAATGDLDLTSNITINGAGAGSTIIDGGALDRVFHVTGDDTVNISGVTVRNGSVAGGGGGLRNDGGTLTITNSTVSGNSATGGNHGGGLRNQSGAVTISNSTFSGNSATTGGGLFNGLGYTVTISNSTFSGNSATSGNGGGINNQGTVTISNSTFSDNSASASGGGINNNGTATLKNTIVANSTTGGNCSGTITNGGNNIDDGTTCAWGSTSGSMSSTNPLLGALANNGGPTQTFALLTGSPAIDGLTFNAPNSAPSTDQRGVARPQGARYDIGAYELEQAAASSACTLSTTFSGSATVSNGNAYYLNCFYGHVYVDNGEGRATGGNHFQGSATLTGNGATVCLQVPAGYTAATPTCVTDSGGGRKDFGIRPIAQALSQTTTGAQSVGANGGAFNCSRWTLTIPAGVLPDNSSLQCGAFDPSVTTGAPAGFKFMGQMINVLILDNTGAARRTFNPPLTVCYTYTDADLLAAGGDPNNFVIQTADIGGAWATMTTTVNTTTRQVCATTDHLTLFELAARAPTSLPVTGGDLTPWIAALLLSALIIVSAAAGVFVWRRKN